MSREICGAIITIDGGVKNEAMVLETAKRIVDLLKQMTNWKVSAKEWLTGRGIEEEDHEEHTCSLCNTTFIAERVKRHHLGELIGDGTFTIDVKCPNCGTWKEAIDQSD